MLKWIMRNIRHHRRAFLLFLGLLCPLLPGCGKKEAPVLPTQPPAQPAVITLQNTPAPTSVPTATPTPAPGELKYLFLFIGDGMGPNQVLAADETLAALGEGPLCITKDFPVRGEAATDNALGKTTDSAAAATALSTGYKTENGVLGKDQNGKRRSGIAERLVKDGWGVGILSTVSLDNATPAGFYAHTDSRTDYEGIIANLFSSGFQYFAGGGFHGKADRTAAAQKAGYTIAIGEEAAAAVPAEGKLILTGQTLMGDKGLPLAADNTDGRKGQLARYVSNGIARLSTYERFFLMAEGGRIDLAGHYHDPGDLYREMLDFDEAVAVAVDFYRAHPAETLILVTADHETGGLTLAPGDRRALAAQTMSCDRFDEVHVPLFIQLKTPFAQALPEIEAAFGLAELTQEETSELQIAYEHTVKGDLSSAQRKAQYGVYAPVTCAAANIVSARAGLTFTTGGHTGVNVPVYALGAGDGAFAGVYENTRIPAMLLELLG